jgi:hypothetical protein
MMMMLLLLLLLPVEKERDENVETMRAREKGKIAIHRDCYAQITLLYR